MFETPEWEGDRGFTALHKIGSSHTGADYGHYKLPLSMGEGCL